MVVFVIGTELQKTAYVVAYVTADQLSETAGLDVGVVERSCKFGEVSLQNTDWQFEAVPFAGQHDATTA
jgi:hypothetical protein